MPAKVILIGLDSADRGLVDEWCGSGDLPFLRSLRERGASGHLTGFAALGDDATWASFSTGVTPGRHGRYFWSYQAPGTYERRPWRERTPLQQPFWHDLSRSGFRVAVTDVPKCPLVNGLNGVQIADWLVHGRDYPETCSWPPELAEDLIRRFGNDRTDRVDAGWLCRLQALPDEQLDEFQQRLHQGLEQKTVFASELLEREDWDLFVIVFKEAHCIGHQCWNRPERVKSVYQALDRAVDRLAGTLGPETSLIVFSDLAMGPNFTGEHLLDQVLQRLERTVATPRQRAELAARRAPRRRRARWWRRAETGRAPADRLAFQVEHNEISGAVRINVKGRDPAGIVLPGEEYRQCRDVLASELLALRHPQTGDPLIEQVLSTDEAYPGAQRADLPDLFAVWARRQPITGARSRSVGTLRCAPPDYRRGNHLEGGLFLGVGPRVSPGRHVGRASIVDLAPTVATLLDTSLAGRDGTPMPALCQGRGA